MATRNAVNISGNDITAARQHHRLRREEDLDSDPLQKRADRTAPRQNLQHHESDRRRRQHQRQRADGVDDSPFVPARHDHAASANATGAMQSVLIAAMVRVKRRMWGMAGSLLCA